MESFNLQNTLRNSSITYSGDKANALSEEMFLLTNAVDIECVDTRLNSRTLIGGEAGKEVFFNELTDLQTGDVFYFSQFGLSSDVPYASYASEEERLPLFHEREIKIRSLSDDHPTDESFEDYLRELLRTSINW